MVRRDAEDVPPPQGEGVSEAVQRGASTQAATRSEACSSTESQPGGRAALHGEGHIGSESTEARGRLRRGPALSPV